MLKKLFKIIILAFLVVGIILGISITIKKRVPHNVKKEAEAKIFNMIQTQTAEIDKFYTYGRAFNLSGKISNIKKDNFESAKLVVTDGSDYEKEYTLDYDFNEDNLLFSTKEINSEIVIDNLENKEYYILLRLKLNNSIDPRYYSLVNSSEYSDIEYYTVSKDGKNRKVSISFNKKNYKNKEYDFLTIALEDSVLPEDVYDIVIDAGHGGRDLGENVGAIYEADITLDYAKALKETLEEKGYKVKLTRDDDNTADYTYTNMYDEDGRISIACVSNAKLMISLHVNNGAETLNGFEIYAPCKSDLSFASKMANKIKEYSSINYSNNSSFKELEGVYVKNYNNKMIKDTEASAKRKGYEPYPITTDTPYLYTIREVGGIGTNAYVDGRNTEYSKNNYYKSNHGIECYQIELGYIKKDLEIIQNEEEAIIRAISETINENF